MDLDRSLRGSLPCVVCGYDLRGLSIRGVCPECGTAVRAAILHAVDPEAEELRPVRRRRLTASALVAWSGAGLLAALLGWGVRLESAAGAGFGTALPTRWAADLQLIAACVSGIALLALVAPTRGGPFSHRVGVAIAALAYAPLLACLFAVRSIDAGLGEPYFGGAVSPDRAWYRLGMGASLVMIFIAFRPTAREFVRRSLAMRTGRVDRQTLLAMALAVAIAAIGDGLRIASVHTGGALLPFVGSLLVFIGSAFLTLGIASALADSLRIARVILLPPPSLRDVLGDDHAG